MRQVRTFAYDGLRRKTSQTLPESGTTTYEYNAHGLLEWQTDALGVTTTYDYDMGHRLTSRSYTDSTPAVSFLYYTTGNRKQMIDALGTVSYDYDAMDRLTLEERTLTGLPGTFTTGYTYNRKGNLTQVTDPSGLSRETPVPPPTLPISWPGWMTLLRSSISSASSAEFVGSPKACAHISN